MDGISCRYCYYRVFFKLNGLTESSNVEDVKKCILLGLKNKQAVMF